MGNLSLPEIGKENVTQDPKILTALEKLNGILDSTNEKVSGVINWLTPKVIATEQTRESTSYGMLTTADEVPSVVVPENGLVAVLYNANWKSSNASAGRAAIFIGSNQLRGKEAVAEISTNGTGFCTLGTASSGGFFNEATATTFVSTGQSFAAGVALIRVGTAGTYSISVQFKASSGSVTAKERYLTVGANR